MKYIIPLIFFVPGVALADFECYPPSPIKPIPPMECIDLVLSECRCDKDGKNCYREWICVPRPGWEGSDPTELVDELEYPTLD